LLAIIQLSIKLSQTKLLVTMEQCAPLYCIVGFNIPLDSS